MTSHSAMHDKFLLCKKCCCREVEEPQAGIFEVRKDFSPPPAEPPELPGLPPPPPPLPPPPLLPDADEDAVADDDDDAQARLRLTAGAPEVLALLPEALFLLEPAPEDEVVEEGSVSNGGPGIDGPETESLL